MYYRLQCLPKVKPEESTALVQENQDPKQLNLAPGITDLPGEHSNVTVSEAEQGYGEEGYHVFPLG